MRVVDCTEDTLAALAHDKSTGALASKSGSGLHQRGRSIGRLSDDAGGSGRPGGSHSPSPFATTPRSTTPEPGAEGAAAAPPERGPGISEQEVAAAAEGLQRQLLLLRAGTAAGPSGNGYGARRARDLGGAVGAGAERGERDA